MQVTRSLSDTWFADIFSHSVGSLSTFLVVSFDEYTFFLILKDNFIKYIFFLLFLVLLESYLRIHCQIP